ncbi:hypothetical protein ACLM5J_15745 [Nocardioides sp. Bht2]|uniref:hypothetical protein n=1 Tax=Nocardioides sp. Bht2 TaxID=3392297 RepID=UPI0039B5173A
MAVADGFVTLGCQFFPGVQGGSAGEVADALADLGLLGAVSSMLVGDPPSREAYLLADLDGRVLRRVGDAVESGPELAELLEPLAVATGCAVGIESSDLVFSVPGWKPLDDARDRSAAVGDVVSAPLGGRSAEEVAQEWAQSAGSPLRYCEQDGVVVAGFAKPTAALHRLHFGEGQHPVLVLSLIRGLRHLNVLSDGEALPGIVLRPDQPMALSFDAAELRPVFAADGDEFDEFVAWAAAPLGVAGSALAELLAESRFADVDAEAVGAAFAAANDADWSARLLTALGLNTTIAEVHEGRMSLGDVEVEAASRWGRLLRRRR